MTSRTEPVVREAAAADIAAICQFGEDHVRRHYEPLIGAEAAEGQVRSWWNESHVGTAVAQGLVVVAEADGELVGVAQRGRSGAEHVVYKLYVHPQHRGRGLGPQLLDALTRQLPADTDRLYIEHFVANARAGSFYEREGFAVERVEPSPTGDPGLGVVWRVRQLRPVEPTSEGM
ncbi:GNAT family N-acetyltransferase [Ornithinicoccus halotolerans]|uniref:GNAT family N-acetyltransferase n=1 Tax=Ornithinicoccus halotolerans TaxID=1748220 RepID=UPI001E3A2933|nr:GNAT family N-acetyltransferase [Ornithinicoccus halotolerans]